jgi:POT family proton-dependent oligopeptide transporter
VEKMLQTIKEFSKGPGILISTIMWEYFSIYGLRALLIYYLTQHLSFTDANADQLYAGFISLIWVSPLLGGWLADKYLGFKACVISGCVLIILGNVAISLPYMDSVYLGLSLLICGIGFFKTNSICLIGSYYKDQPEKLPSIMTLYYVGGNIGATLAPLICAYTQKYYGYSIALSMAAFGMALGLTTLLIARKRLSGVGGVPASATINTQKIMYILAGLAVFAISLCFVLKYNATAYVLVIAIGITIFNLTKVTKNLTSQTKRKLLAIGGLTIAAVFFWILDQQGGSSISLFIARNVKLDGIPPALFQSINPFIIIVAGLVLSYWLSGKVKNASLSSMTMRVCAGIVLVTIGYAVLTFSAMYAEKLGLAPMWGIVASLSLIGAAELFIDPVLLAGVSSTAPQSSVGSFMAVYYLFSGALANFLSGKVASLSAVPDSIVHSKNLTLSAKVYAGVFTGITWTGVGVSILLLAIALAIWAKKARLLTTPVKSVNPI